jgi:hypothetical protein
MGWALGQGDRMLSSQTGPPSRGFMATLELADTGKLKPMSGRRDKSDDLMLLLQPSLPPSSNGCL